MGEGRIAAPAAAWSGARPGRGEVDVRIDPFTIGEIYFFGDEAPLAAIGGGIRERNGRSAQWRMGRAGGAADAEG
ncbi:MAG TPA: hypothetical protein VM120_18895 [Bryobacteraceae bacterium]|nr:hypothetical protein [Bryobacteraceae bacterium]